MLHNIAGIACIVSDIPRAISIKIDDSNNSIVWNLNQPVRRNRSCTAQIQDATSDSAAHFEGGGPFRQCNILLFNKARVRAVASSIPRIVVLAKDKQGFIRNACNYSCGRIRSRAKIKATASDGAENAGEHITTSFLAMGIEKAELLFEAPQKLS